MSTFRISTGTYKNKRLRVPDSARPVRERVKLAVFSIIGDRTVGASCIDLYAGSGNLGLEAMSRGASDCTFVDDDYFAIEAILANVQSVLPEEDRDNATVLKHDAVKYVTNSPMYYDVVFLDPPYDLPKRHTLKFIHEIMNNDAILVYFHQKNDTESVDELNPNIKVEDSRTYGITKVDFIVKK